MTKPINPLPSLLRASAWDAANMQMRAAGRKKWNRADYNKAAETQDRLIRTCYGKPSENEPRMCFIRFQIAESWQKAGHIDLYSNWPVVMREIDAALGPAPPTADPQREGVGR